MEVNPILIDTNAYSALKRGEAEAIEILETAPVVGVSSIVLGELYSGFLTGKRKAANRKELAEFLSRPGVEVFSADDGTAEQYAELSAGLRKAGTPIPTNDMWIAATPLQHGFDVFSYDAHFQAVEGLRVGSSLADFQST